MLVDQLGEINLFRELSPARTVRGLECDGQCVIEPVWKVSPRTGELEGYYFYFCGRECGPFHFNPDEVRRWELVLENFGWMIANVTGLSGAWSRTCRSGFCSVRSRPVAACCVTGQVKTVLPQVW